MFKLVHTCSNMFKLDQTCSNLFKLVQSCSNLIKLVQTCSNLIKLDQIGLNLIQIDQICSIWIKLDQIGTNWIKSDQIGSKIPESAIVCSCCCRRCCCHGLSARFRSGHRSAPHGQLRLAAQWTSALCQWGEEGRNWSSSCWCSIASKSVHKQKNREQLYVEGTAHSGFK